MAIKRSNRTQERKQINAALAAITTSNGNLVAGSGVLLSGVLTNRLLGSGNVTVTVTGGGSGGGSSNSYFPGGW